MPTNTHCSLALIAATSRRLLAFFAGVSAAAAAVTSEPVGISSVPLAAATDVVATVPLLRPAVFCGQILSVAGSTVTIAGTPAWTPGQFVYSSGTQPNTHFVLMSSGALEGRSFTVTGNGAGTLTLDLAGGNLDSVVPGDALRIVPYWTLGSLFPASAAGSMFTATTVPASPQTTLGLFVPPATGINGSPASTFFFYSGAWRQTGQSLSVSKDDQPISMESPIRIRNAVNGGALVAVGAVVMHKLAFRITTSAGAQQDNPVALARPVPVTLDAAGLIASGAFAASAGPLARADLLMVTDNTAPGINKAPVAYYIYYNSGWRKLGQPLTTDFGTDVVFDSSKSVTIRTGTSPGGAVRYWINAATY